MHLRAMRHSTIRVVRQPGRRLVHVTSPVIAVGLVRGACLAAVPRDPATASPALAGTFALRGEPGLHAARKQDDGKPPP